MDSPLGLNDDERAALAAWADDVDDDDERPSDAFTEKVLTAWLTEQARSTDEGVVEEPPPEIEPRVAASPGRRRTVGWVGALATAAVVLLMVRVLPGASEAGHVKGGDACDPSKGQGQGPGLGDEPERPAATSIPTSSEGEPAVLGARAGQVLAHHCSPCHFSSDPEGRAGALRVFDLEQPYWWSSMSDAQLEDAGTRVRELGASTDDERGNVGAFVQAELRRRARAG